MARIVMLGHGAPWNEWTGSSSTAPVSSPLMHRTPTPRLDEFPKSKTYVQDIGYVSEEELIRSGQGKRRHKERSEEQQ